MKDPWTPLLLSIDACNIYSANVAKEEREALAIFHFGTKRFKRHDPINAVTHQNSICNHKWPYQNEEW